MVAKIYLGLVGLLYGVFGIMFFVDPQFYATKVSFPLLDAKAQIEIMAVYGGLELAIAIAVLYGFIKKSLLFPAYLCMWSLIGFFGGRLIGVLNKGLIGDHLYYLIFEFILLCMSIYSFRNIKK